MQLMLVALLQKNCCVMMKDDIFTQTYQDWGLVLKWRTNIAAPSRNSANWPMTQTNECHLTVDKTACMIFCQKRYARSFEHWRESKGWTLVGPLIGTKEPWENCRGGASYSHMSYMWTQEFDNNHVCWFSHCSAYRRKFTSDSIC